MKPIADLVKKLTPEQQKKLSQHLKIGNSGEKNLLKALLCPVGIYEILRSCTDAERNIIQLIYKANDGLTFGELGKHTGIGISEIEAMANNLSQKLLLYVTKNRQLLTNKLDKAYPFAEISGLLDIAETANLNEKLKKLRAALEQKKAASIQKSKEADVEKLLYYITDNGGITTLENLLSVFSGDELNSTIEKAISSDLLSIRYSLSLDFNAYVIINEKLLPAMIRETASSSAKTQKTVLVRNDYRFVLNMLYAYDSISSYGLFLTKQMVFRKIDYNRIVNSMITIKNQNNENVEKENICQLALFFFSQLMALKLEKDAAKISISSLREAFETPYMLIGKMLQSLDLSNKDHEFFAPLSQTPPYKMVHLAIRLLHSMGETPYAYLKTALLISIIEAEKKDLSATIAEIDKKKEEIESGLNLLCILGVICINDGNYMLSDVGYDTAMFLFKLKPKEQKYEKQIYINPDFSLMMPLQEISAICAYSVLAWCEIVKDDVIVNAQISRSSIVAAQKRGFALEPFMKSLKECSKNEIPQNMEFQLNEWSKQTLKITIDNVILIKTNHPTFFDEIMYSKEINNSIEVISPDYAIIHRRHIDDIVKLAAKRNAVISLFEKINEE